MLDPAVPLALQYPLDAAALHPDLRSEAGTSYYRECASARTRLKSLLKLHLDIEHDLLLLSNTTHGLLTVLAGLSLDGICLDTRFSKYPPYSEFPSYRPATPIDRVRLLTHVDPITGEIAPIPETSPMVTVVDTAQSFATVHYHRDVERADIYICPLHKHCGIATGLGLLAIRPTVAVATVRALASVAESATSSLALLMAAEERIIAHGGKILNRLTVNVAQHFREQMAARGIEILTPADANLPFISLRGIDPWLADRAASPLGLAVKYFRRHNVTRISGTERGKLGCDPLDRAKELQNELLRVTHGRVK